MTRREGQNSTLKKTMFVTDGVFPSGLTVSLLILDCMGLGVPIWNIFGGDSAHNSKFNIDFAAFHSVK